jgi:choline dehydrogenase-like flavoprotein
VTYVPQALQAHATLFCEAQVRELLIERGRVVGVVAEARARLNGSGPRRRLVVRAPVVVLACGTYGTPAFLLRSRLANDSGQLGRNLSLHPALAVSALFEDSVRGWDAIPQGYWIDEFRDEGLTYEGGFTPLDLFAGATDGHGPAFTELMEHFDHLALFGFMVEDTSRGRVRLGPGGRALVTYSVNRQDLAVMKRGMVTLAEIYFAGGARRVLPPVHGWAQLDDLSDLERFRRADYRPRDLSISAYHPLGTARMGIDPRSSVVGADHAVHGVPGLYIVDGSSVPSSLAANPQITIMAMATRAAELLATRLG